MPSGLSQPRLACQSGAVAKRDVLVVVLTPGTRFLNMNAERLRSFACKLPAWVRKALTTSSDSEEGKAGFGHEARLNTCCWSTIALHVHDAGTGATHDDRLVALPLKAQSAPLWGMMTQFPPMHS